MEAKQYPFDISTKIGFNCGFSSLTGEYVGNISKKRTVGVSNDNTLIVDFAQWGEEHPLKVH